MTIMVDREMLKWTTKKESETLLLNRTKLFANEAAKFDTATRDKMIFRGYMEAIFKFFTRIFSTTRLIQPELNNS